MTEWLSLSINKFISWVELFCLLFIVIIQWQNASQCGVCFFLHTFYIPGPAWGASSVKVPNDACFLVLLALYNPTQVWPKPSGLLLMNMAMGLACHIHDFITKSWPLCCRLSVFSWYHLWPFICSLWRSQLLDLELSYGEAYVARSWGPPWPIASGKVSPANGPLSHLGSQSFTRRALR